MTNTTETLAAAQSYLAAGFSLIPIKADGSKAPALAQWKAFQQARPGESQLEGWFGDGTRYGIGLIHGAVSGHSEALDFDQPGLYPRFAGLCHQQGWGDLLDRLTLLETPSGGHHLLYRCTEPVGGNAKLAETADRKTLIETRGEGGYTLAPASPLACHPAGTPYLFLRGGIGAVPTITAAERVALHDMARLFNQYADPRKIVDAPHQKARPGEALRPGDDYNQRGDYPALLERHGWRELGQAGDKTLWQRPGKTGPGISATGNYAGSNLFYVFSVNAAPFAPQTAYSPFAVYTLLEHAGDFREAARALAQEGFGEPMPPKDAVMTSGLAALPPRRKPLAERIIDLADVGPPGELPLLFGPYLLKAHAHWLTGQTGIGEKYHLVQCRYCSGRGYAALGH